jgi:nicotinate-nucleotide adenylyltransferase
MGRPRHRADTALIKTGLLGGSFNPAHAAHRQISLLAAKALGLDEVWWLVSPGNPLKPRAGMAPLSVRLRSAQKCARRSIIRATAIEQQLGTRYTVDTLRALRRRHPERSFVWLMGADNLAQFSDWKNWRGIARTMPIAVIARPGYDASAQASRAMGWLRGFVRPRSAAFKGTMWRPPALVLLRFRPDKTSATALRRADPDWSSAFPHTHVRDAVTHRLVD